MWPKLISGANFLFFFCSSLEKWEMGIRKPPEWAAALIIEKLESMGGRKTAEKEN
ncbi:MAG: hypothetical protein ACLUAA_04425 [Acidaminococcus intestini]